jgi:release factor glutamine methyltransferase
VTLRSITSLLAEAGIGDARHEAMLLAEHFLNIPPSRLVIMQDEELCCDELDCAVLRRASRYPLQYLLGTWTFLGDDYEVSEDCLIPRPETEELASLALRSLPEGGKMADLCSGSGCIGVSVMKRRTDCTCTAVEKYPAAMKMTEKNARRHGVSHRMELITADVTEDALTGLYDVIVSNPPYVTEEEMAGLEKELSYEPRHALTDGGNGLSIIEAELKIYPAHLKAGGVLAIEIGSGQGDAVRMLAERHGIIGEIMTDSCDRDRIFLYRRNER